MRYFKISYKTISKYNSIVHSNLIILSKPTGEIGADAQAALNLFISNIGNLKKYDVFEIQELDENENPIGEPIKPTDKTTIVPIKK